MHIPDGYLSPATCATLYAGSAPFWYVSLRRMKRSLHTRMVPLLSVFSAFAFILMMFNLPLPGGTTGHAVGVSIAAIVLGPWASILAISVALIIQAIFFGDGGITAIGANSFNMAILGSFAAYAIYRLISGTSPVGAPRRVIAAALAGYAAINISALATAIELGLQPLLYRDPSGAPLYAPYPLIISVPAMMAGHLTILGLAELIVAGGVVAYLQRSEPELLRLTAPEAVPSIATPDDPSQVRESDPWRATKPLWIILAILLVLTPLGILAIGSAWGEWSAADFSNPRMRAAIAAVSGGSAPAQAPPGIARLEKLWAAPLAHYAPSIALNPSIDYLISAVLGAAFVLAVIFAAAFAFRKLGLLRSRGFLERTLAALLRATDYSIRADQLAEQRGLLQRIDPRVKLLGLACLILASVTARHLRVILTIFAASIVLAALSRVSPVRLAPWVWIPVLAFTGLIAAPALFLTPGAPLAVFPAIGVTAQGLRSAAFLVTRAETAATLSALLILTTPWPWVLKSLRVLRCPLVLVTILGMTYRYIFEILRSALDMLESRRSRTVGALRSGDARRLAASATGVLLSRSFDLGRDVHLAMRSRGFRGEVHVLTEFRARAVDWFWLAGFVGLSAAAIWWGR